MSVDQLERTLPTAWYRQDWTVCEAVQNVRARVHTYGYFAPMQDYNLDIRRYVRERIGAFIHCAAELI